MSTDKLSCREVVVLVTDYLEKALLPEMQVQFEEHVADCPGCTTYVEQTRQTISMLHQLAEIPIFPESKEELLLIFHNWHRT